MSTIKIRLKEEFKDSYVFVTHSMVFEVPINEWKDDDGYFMPIGGKSLFDKDHFEPVNQPKKILRGTHETLEEIEDKYLNGYSDSAKAISDASKRIHDLEGMLHETVVQLHAKRLKLEMIEARTKASIKQLQEVLNTGGEDDP